MWNGTRQVQFGKKLMYQEGIPYVWNCWLYWTKECYAHYHEWVKKT